MAERVALEDNIDAAIERLAELVFAYLDRWRAARLRRESFAGIDRTTSPRWFVRSGMIVVPPRHAKTMHISLHAQWWNL